MIKIGSRASKLALIQAEQVRQEIERHFKVSCEIVPIKTTGDKITDKALYDIGGKALFLKELEEALLSNEVDLAVHSMKDVPAEIPDELEIKTVLQGADPRDVLISKVADNIKNLPLKAKVGTCSVRRIAQLLNVRPDLEIVELRGNIITRLEKLESQNLDAIILAAAGLDRLGIFNRNCYYIEVDEMLPAVGQGVIAVEARKSIPSFLQDVCARINHRATWEALQAERGFLERLNGGCTMPIAALATHIDDDKIYCEYLVAKRDGSVILREVRQVNVADAYRAGVDVAEKFLSNPKCSFLHQYLEK